MSRGGHMWVWDEGGAIHGMSAGTVDPRMDLGVVRPARPRGAGIGRALFAAACDALIAAGLRSLRLGTDPDTRAAHFYRAASWREAGRRKAS